MIGGTAFWIIYWALYLSVQEHSDYLAFPFAWLSVEPRHISLCACSMCRPVSISIGLNTCSLSTISFWGSQPIKKKVSTFWWIPTHSLGTTDCLRISHKMTAKISIHKLEKVCQLYEIMWLKNIVYIIQNSLKEGAEPVNLWQPTLFLKARGWRHLELIVPLFIFFPNHMNTNPFCKPSLSTVRRAIQLIIKRTAQ